MQPTQRSGDRGPKGYRHGGPANVPSAAYYRLERGSGREQPVIPPTAIFETWKAAVRTIDCSKNPCTTTVTPDSNPAINDWDVGLGSDPVPAGLTHQLCGAEVRGDMF